MAEAAYLDLRDLTVGDGPVLDGFSTSVARGGLHAVISTDPRSTSMAIDLAGGFRRPRHGRILLDSRDLALRAPGERGMMTVRREPALFPHMSVFGNIAFPLEQRGHDSIEVRKRVERLADELGIENSLLARPAGTFSGETEIRIALARALAGEPEVLLLDHPLSSLSLAGRRAMWPELKRLHRHFNLTIVLATDDFSEAMALAGTVSVLAAGRECQSGKPEDIFARPANAAIAVLTGPCNLLPVGIEVTEGRAVARHPVLQAGSVELARDRFDPLLHSGDSARMLVRPEAIRLFLGIRRFDMLADGEIVDVMPRGGGAQIRVRTDGYPAGIIADVPLPGPYPLDPGRRVTLGWNRGDAYLLPEA